MPTPRLAWASRLVVTVAGGASAADLNLAAVNAYSGQEQVTSMSQFSDLRPTDWAYQALSNLVDRYGCVAGYPSGSFRGGQAMGRYGAAALLNACLDRSLQRLVGGPGAFTTGDCLPGGMRRC